MTTSVIRSRVALLSGTGMVQLLANAAAATIATAVLGPHERGVMVLVLTGASIVAVVAVLGTGPSLRSRLPATADDAARRGLVCAYTWVSIVGVVCAALLAWAACLGSALVVDPALGQGVLPVASMVFGVGQVLMLQSTEAWFADGRFRDGGLSAAAVAAGGLIGIVLASTVVPAAGVLLLGQALGQLAAGLVVVQRLHRAGLLLMSRPDPAVVRGLVVHGSPALGLTLGLAIALRADRFVLGIVAGPAAVGIYSLAATVSETVRPLPQSIGQLFMHDAARGAGSRQLIRSCLIACGLSAVAAAGVAGVAAVAIVPVFGAGFADARNLLIPLVLAEILFAPYAVASRGVLGRGWTTSAALLGLVAGGLAVATYSVGASLAGSFGLAVACVILYSFLSAATTAMFVRRSGR